MINYICRVDRQAGDKEKTENKKGRNPTTKKQPSPPKKPKPLLVKQLQHYQESPKTHFNKFSYDYAAPTNSICDEVKMNITTVFPQIKVRTIIKEISALSNHARQTVCVLHGCYTSPHGSEHPSKMLASTHIHKQVCF